MITISRQAGAGGEEITGLLARELGWKVLDNEGVERLLAEKGFPQPEAEAFTERRPGLWHRLSAEKDRYLQSLKMVSYEFARRGSCIVLGRGGQILFGEVPGILRVRVVAPLAERIRSMRETSGGDEEHARHAVHHEDAERTGFYRFLFRANWDCADLYDLVINTHLLSPKAAAALILKAVGSREVTEQRVHALRKLEDLYRAQKTVMAILFEQKLPIRCLQVVADDGTVTLKGTAEDNPSIAQAEQVASGLLRAKRIDNQICFVPRFAEILAGIHPEVTASAGTSPD